jgi:hypothetical protein
MLKSCKVEKGDGRGRKKEEGRRKNAEEGIDGIRGRGNAEDEGRESRKGKAESEKSGSLRGFPFSLLPMFSMGLSLYS